MQELQGIHKIPFSGSSMNPLFNNANSVWIDFSKNKNPRIGDVLVYKAENNEFVCHRLIGISNDILYLKGDNSLWTEQLSPRLNWGHVVAFDVDGKRNDVKNHILLRPYCWSQLWFLNVHSLYFRRLVRKFGQIYLHLVKVFIARQF